MRAEMYLQENTTEYDSNESAHIQYSTGSLEKVFKDLRAGQVHRNMARIEDVAPEFTLCNQVGERINLKEKLASGPVVLFFNQGDRNSNRSSEIDSIENILPSISSYKASLLVVTPQTLYESDNTAGDINFKYDKLSDVENRVASQYGLVFEFTDQLEKNFETFGIDRMYYDKLQGWMLPVPAIYIIHPNQNILFSYVKTNDRLQVNPKDILETLRENYAH